MKTNHLKECTKECLLTALNIFCYKKGETEETARLIFKECGLPFNLREERKNGGGLFDSICQYKGTTYLDKEHFKTHRLIVQELQKELEKIDTGWLNYYIASLVVCLNWIWAEEREPKEGNYKYNFLRIETE